MERGVRYVCCVESDSKNFTHIYVLPSTFLTEVELRCLYISVWTGDRELQALWSWQQQKTELTFFTPLILKAPLCRGRRKLQTPHRLLFRVCFVLFARIKSQISPLHVQDVMTVAMWLVSFKLASCHLVFSAALCWSMCRTSSDQICAERPHRTVENGGSIISLCMYCIY